MRINQWLAKNTDLSRRKADEAISDGRVKVNGSVIKLTQVVNDPDNQQILLDGHLIKVKTNQTLVLLLNKPLGYVCSRDGQGSKTVYDLLPDNLKDLNIAGRLDKDSHGLVVMTNDGNLLNELTHPSSNKHKIYEVSTTRPLDINDQKKLEKGVDIGDNRLSKLKIYKITPNKYRVTMYEGRNRQIRRTFEALNYEVKSLNRTNLGNYQLSDLPLGKYKIL
jgi:23S rRNA pseudouridine2605 synthase